MMDIKILAKNKPKFLDRVERELYYIDHDATHVRCWNIKVDMMGGEMAIELLPFSSIERKHLEALKERVPEVKEVVAVD